jgi:hypothetical protein
VLEDGGTLTATVGDRLVLPRGRILEATLALPEADGEATYRVQTTRRALSVEAPPRAGVAVLAGAGDPLGRSIATGADAVMLDWDPDSGLLAFDPIPIVWSDGVTASGADPLLDGGWIGISGLTDAGADGDRRWFGGGTLTLSDATGTPLLIADLPWLVFEDSLVGSQGFNLFAPIFHILAAETGRSPWLDGFLALAASGAWLPQLFLGFDQAALGDDPWARAFRAPVRGMLSFTGAGSALDPAGASAPGTAPLFVIGLLLIASGWTAGRRTPAAGSGAER